MGATCRTKSGIWIEVVANDSNFAELAAIKLALDGENERKWPDCIILSHSAIAGDNVMGVTGIRDRYANITSISMEALKEGWVLRVQKMEKDQVSGANALAKAVTKEDPKHHDFLQISTSLEEPKTNEPKYFF